MPINDFGIISVDIAIYINIANLKLRKGLEVMSKKFFCRFIVLYRCSICAGAINENNTEGFCRC